MDSHSATLTETSYSLEFASDVLVTSTCIFQVEVSTESYHARNTLVPLICSLYKLTLIIYILTSTYFLLLTKVGRTSNWVETSLAFTLEHFDIKFN